MRRDEPDIRYLFKPRSVAVIGASPDTRKIGYKILDNIVSGGYPGRIYPVNSRGDQILGLRGYKDIGEVENEVDVGVIVVPAKSVFDVVRGCAEKGVKFAPIISSGFSEIGNREEEKKIVACARDHGMRVLGPNIFGVFSASSSLNATFGPKNIKPGNIAIITQSGALGIAMIGKTTVENIGLSAIVSVGNKSDINETDLLEYFLQHDATRVILIYIEGLKAGERFVRVLQETAKQKPIVILKAGRSKKGAMAAASHTGALAGSDEIFDYLMRQAHAIRAESLGDALEWCKFFANSPLPQEENAVIITNGGGIGVLATDACEKYGVKLYDDYEHLKETFSGMMPYFGSTKNPIDLTGEATSSLYQNAFKASFEDPDIHAVISMYCETAVFDIENLSPIIEENYRNFREAKKPTVFCLVGGEKTENCVVSLKKRDVPVFTDPYEAVSCMGAMYTYYRYLQDPPVRVDPVLIDNAEIERVIQKVKEEKRHFLLADEGQKVMKAAGIPVPSSFIAHHLEEAVSAAETMGFPVVMKIVSKDILHKSDVGGVALDLMDRKEVIEAYEAIIHNCRKANPHARLEGVEVSEMVKSGAELIVGARNDPSFGPIVMCGLGGIYVEVMKDVSFRGFPLDRREVITMIKEIKSYPILLGVRGEKKKDIESLVNAILKVGAILQSHLGGNPGISDIEINPLVVDDRGAKAVDVRILLSAY
jgi:acetyl coenzyme A synthetase (ADP forming)-like protein